MAYVIPGSAEDKSNFPHCVNYPDSTWITVYNGVEKEFVYGKKAKTASEIDMVAFRNRSSVPDPIGLSPEPAKEPAGPVVAMNQDIDVDSVLSEFTQTVETKATGPKIKRR